MADVPADPRSDQEIRLERAWSKIVEFFPDALIIVRSEGGLRWRCTDATWGLGAAERYRDSVRQGDREQIEADE